MNDRVIETAGKTYRVHLRDPFIRYPGNPILTPRDVNKVWKEAKRQVVTVHNAGIAKYDGRTIMLFRSHLRNGISVIGMAKSTDGLTDWKISPVPALKPAKADDHFGADCDAGEQMEREAGGVEDPRISKIGDKYYITYSAYHGTIEDRVRVCLAVTEDFKTFIRYGPVLHRDMRNVVLFPEKSGGHYYALMRPNDEASTGHKGGIFKEIRLARATSPSGEWQLIAEPVMRQAGGPGPFQHKIGPGAPPLMTKHGWLSIFHGVRSTMDGNPYVLGVALHDKDDPSRVKVSSLPIVFPTRADCKVDPEEYIHVPQVVFSCGALREEDGTVRIYYGGNDTVMNVGFSHEDILAELCHEFPQDPLTGRPLYEI